MEYVYLGDRFTRNERKRQICMAVRRNGKCVRARNGSMLVAFADGKTDVIIGRLLRKIKQPA
jgi:hypothetical protein